MKYFIIFILVFFSKLVFSQVTPTIEIFQANLTVLSDAFENRDYSLIHSMLHHKEVSDEIFKNEVEFALNDSLLPAKAIIRMNQIGEFGPLLSIIKNERAYTRYLEKSGVKAENCFAYFHEINRMDVLVLAEWNGSTFRLIRIKNLKLLLN